MTARMAVTTAASMPSDKSGSAMAEVAGGGAADAATGDVMKHPTTSTSIMTPTARLMMRVRVLPMRSPIQCTATNNPMIAMAAARGVGAAAGHSAPRYSAAVSAA